MRSVIRLLIPLLLLAGCGAKGTAPLATSGTIQATEVSVAAEVGGKVTAVLVQEGQRVKQGDVLVRLDTAALELLRDQARAALEQAEARLAEVQAGARPEQSRQASEGARAGEQHAAAAASAVVQAEAGLQAARDNHERVRQIYEQGAAPRSQFDAAITQLETATAQAEAARAQAEAARAQARGAQAGAELVNKGATPEQVRQLVAAAAQARAAAGLAQLNLDRARVKAPITGVVLRRLVEPGTMVAVGAAVVTQANLDDLWLRVYVPENRLNLVKLGLPVDVFVNAYPGRPFKAEVVYISDQAEFTPRNVQTKEERATTVYAVKLQLRDGLAGELKTGMPADVTFATPVGGR